MTKGKILIDVNDIVGKRLGKLEVIGYAGHRYDTTVGGDRMRHYYKVRCDCGITKIVHRGQLTSENVHSCGCGKRGKYNGN